MKLPKLSLVAVCLVVSPIHAAHKPEPEESRSAVADLKEFLKTSSLDRVTEQPFAAIPLTKSDAESAQTLLWANYANKIRSEYETPIKDRKLVIGEHTMPFWFAKFGEKPKGGHSLWISMHGGGGTAKRVNDRQWENQKRLYQPKEGIYLAPRAPSNKWNLWHQSHIDQFFDRLITALVVLEDVNPNRVYIMGYSAGGDGVYQLAPRMADRWAAASMMAGHPNDASPLSLRNIGFALFMGGRDAAYKRNQVAAEWKEKLAELKKGDEDGYPHQVTIYPKKGHWMDREDRTALPWMAKFTRDPFPKKVIWKQDDVKHARFYWLGVDEQKMSAHTITASREGNKFRVKTESVEGKVHLLLTDEMVDLDQQVQIDLDGVSHTIQPARTIGTLAESIEGRGDPSLVFDAKVSIATTAKDPN